MDVCPCFLLPILLEVQPKSMHMYPKIYFPNLSAVQDLYTQKVLSHLNHYWYYM